MSTLPRGALLRQPPVRRSRGPSAVRERLRPPGVPHLFLRRCAPPSLLRPHAHHTSHISLPRSLLYTARRICEHSRRPSRRPAQLPPRRGALVVTAERGRRRPPDRPLRLLPARRSDDGVLAIITLEAPGEAELDAAVDALLATSRPTRSPRLLRRRALRLAADLAGDAAGDEGGAAARLRLRVGRSLVLYRVPCSGLNQRSVGGCRENVRLERPHRARPGAAAGGRHGAGRRAGAVGRRCAEQPASTCTTLASRCRAMADTPTQTPEEPSGARGEEGGEDRRAEPPRRRRARRSARTRRRRRRSRRSARRSRC